MHRLITRFYESLIPLRIYLVDEYSPLELYTASSNGAESILESQTNFIVDHSDNSFNRFYSHYGATSIRGHHNLYKDGKTKGKNRKETRPMRHEKLMSILRNSKNKSK